jgi:hypothetical protein
MTDYPPYEYRESEATEEGTKYYFVSKGKTDVVKAVHYAYSTSMEDLKIYNLGFGDYDIEEDTINDKVNTANGDVYKVFNTVLNTIPIFFKKYPKAAVIVEGSDSSHDFHENCKLTCTKKCTDSCKNQHRRINAYSSFVNKNYEELVKDYKFFGGIKTDKGVVIEDFVKRKKYDAVLIIKNN